MGVPLSVIAARQQGGECPDAFKLMSLHVFVACVSHSYTHDAEQCLNKTPRCRRK